ncbi:hypothetical protein Btru_060925 [Bulinus truncatus]|nr:hypothetical protein Btru_060925 [Bulinus truncatus]
MDTFKTRARGMLQRSRVVDSREGENFQAYRPERPLTKRVFHDPKSKECSEWGMYYPEASGSQTVSHRLNHPMTQCLMPHVGGASRSSRYSTTRERQSVEQWLYDWLSSLDPSKKVYDSEGSRDPCPDSAKCDFCRDRVPPRVKATTEGSGTPCQPEAPP